MLESTENNGFVLPKADDKTQAETAVATKLPRILICRVFRKKQDHVI